MEENENKISYECGAVVGFCTVSCQAAEFSHSNGTILRNGVPRNFVRGGEGQQIQLRTEDRENGDLGIWGQ